MSIRNQFCNLCSLGASCANVCVMSEQTKDSCDVLVVFDYPANNSDTFSLDKRYSIIQDLFISVLGYPIEKVRFTYLVKCGPLAVEPTAESGRSCLHYLDAEIKQYAPKAILSFGEYCFNILTGEERVSAKRSNLYSYNGIPLVCTVHPGYAQNAGDIAFENMVKDMDRVRLMGVESVSERKFTTEIRCDTVEKVAAFVEQVKKAGLLCFDLETEGLNYRTEKITLFTASINFGYGYTVPIDHFDSPFNEFEKAEVLSLLKSILSDEEIVKYGWNLKFDKLFLKTYGIETKGVLFDGMLMHHLLNENLRHKLKEVSSSIWPELEGYEDSVKKYNWSEIPLDVLCEYAIIDTDASLRLCVFFESVLQRDARLYALYRNLTAPASYLLTDVEFNGMLVDGEFMDASIVELQGSIDEIQETILKIPTIAAFEAKRRAQAKQDVLRELDEKISAYVRNGKEHTKLYKNLVEKRASVFTGELQIYEGLNLNSVKQLVTLIYEPIGFKMDAPYVREKRGTARVTDKNSLISMKSDATPYFNLFVDSLLELRSYQKVLSTYFIGVKELLDANSYVHTTFNINGTATGRLSSKNPNLQNIPRSGAAGSKVKRLYVAPPGKVILQLDYSQAELRIAALLAKDAEMIRAYANGEDIHRLTALNTLNVSEAKFSALSKPEQKELRNKAKAINFGFLYGMSADGFVEYAKTSYGVEFSLKQAENIRKRFFTLYASLNQWHLDYTIEARENGYVRTLFGRKRRLPDINSSDSFKSSESERQAINSPVQGTAGELTVFVACLFSKFLPKWMTLVNTVHDSLIFYVDEDKVNEAANLLKPFCSNPPVMEYFGFDFSPVGMSVDCEAGKNWKELAEIPV